MKTPITFLAFSTLLAGFSLAQQTPSTSQPASRPNQPTQSATVPCTKAAPSQPRKQGWLEKKARALACQKNKNLCDLPSSGPDITGQTPGSKPCPVSTAGGTAPALKPQPQTSASAAPSATGDKPAYVCPPKTVLIPNTAYCLTADHLTVDAIALPASLAAPTPAPKAPAQSTSNH